MALHIFPEQNPSQLSQLAMIVTLSVMSHAIRAQEGGRVLPPYFSAHAFGDKSECCRRSRLTLCFFCEQQASARLTLDDFFPFGVGNGDNLLPDGDDRVANVPLPTEFFFFDRAYTFFGVSAYKI